MPKISELTAFTDMVDADTFVANDDTTTKKITASNVAVYMSAEHVAAADPHTQYPKIINTDSEAGRTIYVGSVDPDVSYTPVDGDVWIDTSA